VYDSLADVYDWLVPEELLSPAGAAGPFAEVLSPGSRVLDCACGTGTVAIGLALAGFAVEASDASAAMVERTRALGAEHGVHVPAEVRRWEDLSGPPRFDAVLCVGNSLTHARDRRAALAGMERVLRPGGLLVVTSRNWERVRAGGSRLEVDDELVERHGRAAVVVRAWSIPPAWNEPHHMDNAVVFPGAGHVAERLEFWPFMPEQLDEDLRAAGLSPEPSTFAPDVDRYMATARAAASRGSGG